MRERHAGYFTPYARERVLKAGSAEEEPAFHELDAEIENMRAAMDWAER